MKFFTEKPPAPSKEKVLDIKTLLKFARQCIDENNMKKAQQYCKKALRKNSESYMALVLLGKTYGRSDDALFYYEKAIDLKPDHVLAWQGLANYFEGKDDDSAKSKLVNVYCMILSINPEEVYAIKTITKLGQLGCQLQCEETLSFLVDYITDQANEKLVETAKTQFLQLLQSNVSCMDEDIPDIINILKSFNENDLNEENPILILLGKLILENNDFAFAVEEIIALKVFHKSFILKEWLSEILCKTYIKNDSLYDFELHSHVNKLISGIQDTKYGSILIAITLYLRGSYEEAYRRCLYIIKKPFELEENEAIFMLNCSKMLPDGKRKKQFCKYLLKLDNLNNPAYIMTVNTQLLSVYMEQKKFYKSLSYLKKISIEQIDALIISDFGNLYLELEVTDETMLQILDSTDYLDLFKSFVLIKNKKFSEAIELLQSFDKHPIKYYYLALAFWFLDMDEESFESFQKAAELMPNNPKVFYCLAIYYFRRKDDIEESKNCLEISYTLCKTDIKVVKMLSAMYLRLGLVDLEFDLLQTAFDIDETRVFWVCARLGRISYDRGIIDDALMYLQMAINMKPASVNVHEWIGDIYFTKKEYDLALPAYNKVVELSHDSAVFFKCLNRIGCIYSEKMSFHKAIYIFDSILDNDPDNIAALKGITDTRVLIGLQSMSKNLFDEAREHMQSAFNRITTAMATGIKDLVYWHLYGDVLIIMTTLPNEHSFINFQSSEGETKKEKMDMYKMAIEGYSNVIKFRDSNALFKCALAYFEYYCETGNRGFCQTSYNLALLSVKINPNVWAIWDLLGKTCFDLNKSEEYYFCVTKAISLFEDIQTKTWCDLGIFYLKLCKKRLGRYRNLFQHYWPTFSPTWIRVELCKFIAEATEDSPAPYYSQLEYVYGETFDPTLAFMFQVTESKEPTFQYPIKSFKIVPNAGEIIEWYLCLEEETTWTCCSLGNLQERKGLFVPALRYYDRALAISSGNVKNEILSHKGRVLMKMNEYEEAINVYNEVREKNLDDTCALGCALFKMNYYKKSYATYQKALNDLCENDEQQIDVLITMSNVACRLKTLRDGARLLVRAVKIKHGDNADLSLNFMKEHAFKKVDIQLVAHVMTEYLLKYVDQGTWWYYMGLNYLRGVNKFAKLTRACIKRSIRENSEPRRSGKLYALISVSEFYAGNRQKSLDYATRALKFYPVQPELWAVFILCVYADKNWPRKVAFMRAVIDTVRKVVTVSPAMDRWLTKVEDEIIGVPKIFNFN